jgi:hypothetical protein
MNEAKKYTVIISERAKQMLTSHISFLAKVNKHSAKEKKNMIIKALNSLSQMPNRFPFFEEPYIPANKYHKMYIEKYYIVLYQIKDNYVFVDYILDCRKDYNWL